MNKKVFTGLIVLMGISILGIIAVQLVWMNNAIRVKNELFSRSVTEALNQTVSRLESIHNFTVVNEMVLNDSVGWVHETTEEFEFENENHVFVSNHVAPAIIPPGPAPVKIIREIDNKAGKAVIEIKVDTDSSKNNGGGSFSYRIQHNNTIGDKLVFSEENSDKKGVLIFQSDTIFTDADSLYSVGLVKIDSILTKLDTFELVRPDISKRVKVKAGQLKNIAKRVQNEIYMWDIRDIDEELVGEVLTEELQNKNIPIAFDYAIIRDSLVSFPKIVNDSVAVAGSKFNVSLYPNDIFQKNLKLAVFFPGQDRFIYRSINWLLLASFFFSLIILMTFSMSIFYILRQKKISEMKSDFINNMTHEFKTPIATISVAADSIANQKVLNDPERIKYFTGMIKKENNRMNRQVEDILTIARLDKKDFEFKWEAVDVHELINDAVQGIVLQIEKRGGKIGCEFGAANPTITTDKMHCTNVIYNLLDNANKYSTEVPDIKISTRNLTKGVLISVKDNGIGMSKTVQSKIFERFYRQTSGNVHNVKGFGLGLSYVKAVLEANCGNISVHSEPEKGSKFDVFLPFVRS